MHMHSGSSETWTGKKRMFRRHCGMRMYALRPRRIGKRLGIRKSFSKTKKLRSMSKATVSAAARAHFVAGVVINNACGGNAESEQTVYDRSTGPFNKRFFKKHFSLAWKSSLSFSSPPMYVLHAPLQALPSESDKTETNKHIKNRAPNRPQEANRIAHHYEYGKSHSRSHGKD